MLFTKLLIINTEFKLCLDLKILIDEKILSETWLYNFLVMLTSLPFFLYQKDLLNISKQFKCPLVFDFVSVSTSCLIAGRLVSYVKSFPEQVSVPGCIS